MLKIVCCFDIFCPTAMQPRVKKYGVKRIKRLFRHFLSVRYPTRSASEAKNQWCVFRDAFEAFRSSHPNAVDTVGVMMALLREDQFNAYDILRDLCAIALSLPFSTAIVESTFSVMRVIKNYRTNALSARMLDDLICKCMSGPPEISNDKSEEIAALWLSIIDRRFTKTDKSRRPWLRISVFVFHFSAQHA
jgi:hypothetical protein